MTSTVLCGLLLLLMMCVTVIDVVGRYAMNTPLQGATEITELLLLTLIYSGLPAVCLDSEHVIVDLFINKLPARIQPLRLLFIGGISSVVLVVISWRLAVYGQQYASYSAKTSTLHVPLEPVAYFAALMTLIAAVIMAAVGLEAFKTTKGKPA